MSHVYARDLKPEVLNDTFMGKGFEKLLKEAEAKDVDLIVGEYYPNAVLED